MLRNIHRSNLNELIVICRRINFTILKIFSDFISKNQGGAYFDAGSPLAVVSENFMRISRLVRHVFGFGAYSRTPSPDILSIAQWARPIASYQNKENIKSPQALYNTNISKH